jgi:hypothetical protein
VPFLKPSVATRWVVRAAYALLGRALATSIGLELLGFLINEFPDLSVLDHVKRLLCGYFQPFVAGNCLIVDLRQITGYFAPVYNEDWLFVFWYRRRQVSFVADHFVHQREYDPFKPELAIVIAQHLAPEVSMSQLWAPIGFRATP